MIEGHNRVVTSSSSHQASTSDENARDGDLLNRLQVELNVVRQDPDVYPSAWAVALGVPEEVNFSSAALDSGSGATGGYRVSPARLKEWINELRDILQWADDRSKSIRYIQESRSAAPDTSSAMANDAYAKSGQALQRSNDAIKDYCQKLVSAFEESLLTYQGTEHSNRDSMRGLGECH